MKHTLPFVVVALAVLLLLFFLSTSTQAPVVPNDELHKNVMTDGSCAACHAPGRQAPLKPSHPPKEECLLCHKMKKV